MLQRSVSLEGDASLVQAGYNLLYGCWKYSWDADCELFLKILRGEVKEDVYVEQIQLQVQSHDLTLLLYSQSYLGVPVFSVCKSLSVCVCHKVIRMWLMCILKSAFC